MFVRIAMIFRELLQKLYMAVHVARYQTMVSRTIFPNQKVACTTWSTVCPRCAKNYFTNHFM